MKTETFRDFYEELLSDTLDAEYQLIKALPKLAKAASSEELGRAFTEHLEQTKDHASRLEKVFELHNLKPKRIKCKGMEGLIEEGAEVIKEYDEGDLRDAALVCAAQKVEHYEIAGYGTLRTFASMLGESEAQSLLEQTLEEEKAADQKLNLLSESINPEAAGGEAQQKQESGRKTAIRSREKVA
jgi:ferritin-like metal-binding protein YciE